MAKKYHINPETKEVGLCRAVIQCHFADSDGIEPQHFSNVHDAHEEAEKQLHEEHGSFKSLDKESNKEKVYVHIPDNHSFRELTTSERAWKTPTEYFAHGDVIQYEGETYEVEDTDEFYNHHDLEANYHIFTTDGTKIEIDEYSWKNRDLNIEKLEDNDEPIPVPPGSSGARLSDYISPGDTIEYQDENYLVEDFEYNRAILAYELDTDQGKLYINDDDWYHNDTPNIFVKRH